MIAKLAESKLKTGTFYRSVHDPVHGYVHDPRHGDTRIELTDLGLMVKIEVAPYYGPSSVIKFDRFIFTADHVLEMSNDKNGFLPFLRSLVASREDTTKKHMNQVEAVADYVRTLRDQRQHELDTFTRVAIALDEYSALKNKIYNYSAFALKNGGGPGKLTREESSNLYNQFKGYIPLIINRNTNRMATFALLMLMNEFVGSIFNDSNMNDIENLKHRINDEVSSQREREREREEERRGPMASG